MQTLFFHFDQLSRYIYSDSSFSNPKAAKKIEKHLSELSQATRKMKHTPKEAYPEKDPSLPIMMTRLEQSLFQAEESFRQRNYQYARQKLKGAMQNCYYCHTRLSKGLQLEWKTGLKELKATSPFERADFLVASRRFTAAEDELEKIILSKTSSYFEKERALDKYLTVALRVQKDPGKAQRILLGVINGVDFSSYKKDVFRRWVADLESWLKNEDSLGSLDEIEKYLKKTEQKKSYPLDESSNVRYLRASQQLYQFLAQKKVSKQDRARAFYLLGQTYEVLRDNITWELNEVYYEACIEQRPGTPLARDCYKDYENSIVIGYSGSAGLFIPSDVRRKLRHLKSRANSLAYQKK